MTTRSGARAFAWATSRSTKRRPMKGPTCTSVIWTMVNPSSLRGSRGNRTGTSLISAGPKARALAYTAVTAPPASTDTGRLRTIARRPRSIRADTVAGPAGCPARLRPSHRASASPSRTASPKAVATTKLSASAIQLYATTSWACLIAGPRSRTGPRTSRNTVMKSSKALRARWTDRRSRNGRTSRR